MQRERKREREKVCKGIGSKTTKQIQIIMHECVNPVEIPQVTFPLISLKFIAGMYLLVCFNISKRKLMVIVISRQILICNNITAYFRMY